MPATSFKGKDATGATQNFAHHSISEGAETRLLPRMVASDASGNAIALATETSLAAINAKLGALVAGSAPVLIANRVDNAYVASVHLVPSTLTSGTYYLTGVASGTLRIKKIRVGVTFTGTNAASRSVFEIERFTSGTPSGGSSITAVGKASTNAASQLTLSYANGGVTLSPTGNVVVATFAVVSQNSMSDFIEIDMSDAPIMLTANQGLAIKAASTVISGVGLAVGLSWTED